MAPWLIFKIILGSCLLGMSNPRPKAYTQQQKNINLIKKLWNLNKGHSKIKFGVLQGECFRWLSVISNVKRLSIPDCRLCFSADSLWHWSSWLCTQFWRFSDLKKGWCPECQIPHVCSHGGCRETGMERKGKKQLGCLSIECCQMLSNSVHVVFTHGLLKFGCFQSCPKYFKAL